MAVYHKTRIESQQRGDAAEKRFFGLASALGLECEIKKDFHSQCVQHVDMILKKGSKTFKIDIKAQKKASRTDSEVDDSVIWIEFQNVRGSVGWIYGEADYIAFESHDGFNLVCRPSLASWAEQNVDFNNPVKTSKEAYKRVYTRDGRKDSIAWVKFSDIKHLVKKKMIDQK